LVLERDAALYDPPEYWRSHEHGAAGVVREDWAEVFGIEHVRGVPGELRHPNLPIRLNNGSDLPPRRIHVQLLILLNDARAKAGRHAMPRIQVQLVNPIGDGVISLVEQEALGQRVPRAIHRWRDNWVLVSPAEDLRVCRRGA